MVVKGKISKLLVRLQKMYNSTTDTELQVLYSKSALLELSGWTEQTILNISEKNLSTVSRDNRNFFSNGCVRQIKYNSLRTMLCLVIGLNGFEKLEKRLKPPTVSKIKSILDTLATLRNENAHTTMAGFTRTIPAPSILISHFENLYPCLKTLERELRRI